MPSSFRCATYVRRLSSVRRWRGIASLLNASTATDTLLARGAPLIQITGAIALHEREIDERFVRASGPGGQHVNKVATAVELRFDVGVSSLPPDVKLRLTVLAGTRMTVDGVLVLDSREHRTQGQNREAARARLVALIRQAAIRPKTRRPTKPGRAAKERRLTAKKRRADVKGTRGRSRVNED